MLLVYSVLISSLNRPIIHYVRAHTSAPDPVSVANDLVQGSLTLHELGGSRIAAALLNLFLEALQPSGGVHEGIGKFVPARRLSGHPIAVSRYSGKTATIDKCSTHFTSLIFGVIYYLHPFHSLLLLRHYYSIFCYHTVVSNGGHLCTDRLGIRSSCPCAPRVTYQYVVD